MHGFESRCGIGEFHFEFELVADLNVVRRIFEMPQLSRTAAILPACSWCDVNIHARHCTSEDTCLECADNQRFDDDSKKCIDYQSIYAFSGSGSAGMTIEVMDHTGKWKLSGLPDLPAGVCVITSLLCVITSLLCVITPLLCVITSILCVITSLLCVITSLLCMVTPLLCIITWHNRSSPSCPQFLSFLARECCPRLRVLARAYKPVPNSLLSADLMWNETSDRC